MNFDKTLAQYVFCTVNHGGQGCALYARLGKISRVFSPSPLFSEEAFLRGKMGAEYDGALDEYHALEMAREEWRPGYSGPRNLGELIDYMSREGIGFGNSSDDWLYDPERMERCEEYAADGSDGSTPEEYCEDWRSALSDLQAPEYIETIIGDEIDDCERWHEENGSLDIPLGGRREEEEESIG